MTEITQADRDAAAEAFFCKPLLNEKHNDDRRVRAFARHRQYGYDQGYYDGRQATEALSAEIEWLKIQLSVETEPSPYCPICGSCGEEGCCGSKRCMYPDTSIEADREQAAVEERAKIVAWLRELAIVVNDAGSKRHLLATISNSIEAGRHETFTRPDNV